LYRISGIIEIADLQTIKRFIATAASSPEGQNLKLLWARAYKAGLIAGYQVYYEKTEEKLKEAHNSGYELGFREGSSPNTNLFQRGFNEGRHEELEEWIAEGHGQHCGYQPTITHDNSSIQTDPPSLADASTSTVNENDGPRSTIACPP
jgi:hypothetical protein